MSENTSPLLKLKDFTDSLERGDRATLAVIGGNSDFEDLAKRTGQPCFLFPHHSRDKVGRLKWEVFKFFYPDEPYRSRMFETRRHTDDDGLNVEEMSLEGTPFVCFIYTRRPLRDNSFETITLGHIDIRSILEKVASLNAEVLIHSG